MKFFLNEFRLPPHPDHMAHSTRNKESKWLGIGVAVPSEGIAKWITDNQEMCRDKNAKISQCDYKITEQTTWQN